MSKEQSIQAIWNPHWDKEEAAAPDVIKNRFTEEAFRKIALFVTEKDRLILEMGCGTGRFSTLIAKRFPQSTVTGVDIAANALKIGHRLRQFLGCINLYFAQASVFRLPFPDNHFDLVFSEGLVGLFSMAGTATYVDAIREMVRVTKPGGKVLVSVNNWYCFPHTFYKWFLNRLKIPYEYGYEKSFTRRELVEIFHDFNLDHMEFAGYYPSYGFRRLAWRLRAVLGSPSQIFNVIGAVIDKLDNDRLSRSFGFEILIKGMKEPLLR